MKRKHYWLFLLGGLVGANLFAALFVAYLDYSRDAIVILFTAVNLFGYFTFPCRKELFIKNNLDGNSNIH